MTADTEPSSVAYNAMAKLYDGMMDMYGRKYPHLNADIPFYMSFTRSNYDHYLEVGCGSGRVLLPFLRAGYQMTGVDISEGMLQACRDKTGDYLEAGAITIVTS